MAELVDALASGASWCKPVQVRVLFRALINKGSAEGIPSGESPFGHNNLFEVKIFH